MNLAQLAPLPRTCPPTFLNWQSGKMKDIARYLNTRLASFDLPAGLTCPYADQCCGRIVTHAGHRRIQWSPRVKYHCYALRSEVYYPSTYNARRANLAKTRRQDFTRVILAELQRINPQVIRIHSSGDFYNLAYYLSWKSIARSEPTRLFYGYSKNAYAVLDSLQDPLPNLKLVYSLGGKLDGIAQYHHLPTCSVLLPGQDPIYPIACQDYPDDINYINNLQSFHLRLH